MDWLVVAVTLVVSAVVAGLALLFGRRIGFVDPPDGEMKPHSGSPVPLGGVAVFVGLQVGLAMAGLLTVGLSLGLFIALSVGLIDDLRGLSPGIRLVAAMIAGLATALAVTNDPLPVVAVTVLVVATWNAVNLLDGMDALAGGVTGVAAVGIAALGVGSDAWVGWVLAAAVIGFVIWNLPPARLFLGDNGSYVLGVALAWTAVGPAQEALDGLLAAALIGLPFIDLGATVLRRVLDQRPILEGDRDHTYDRLQASGMSVGKVALLLVIAQTVWVGSLVVLSSALSERSALVFAMVMAGGTVIAITVTGREAHDPGEA